MRVKFNEVADCIRNKTLVTVLYDDYSGRKILNLAKIVLNDDDPGSAFDDYMDWCMENGTRDDYDYDYIPTQEDILGMDSFCVNLINATNSARLNGMGIGVFAKSDNYFYVDDEDGDWRIEYADKKCEQDYCRRSGCNSCNL